MSFKDKVVIVTGSSSGIGAATAKLFAREGAKVTLVGRNVNKLKNIERECTELGGVQPLTIVADVSKDEEAKAIVQKTVEHHGKLDVLVNNAGIGSFSSILDTNYMTEFDRIITTNLRAVVVTTNAALPHLIQSKGNIINISSISGVCPTPAMSHYCTSKAALDHFSRSIAAEVASKGVRVNIVSPGPVKTDITHTMGISDEQVEIMGKSTPLGFLIKSEEVGELVLYLASSKAKSITGSTFVIDVGSTLQGITSSLEILK
ncbi:3-oxoacyl-[acyl-carrier-protein] reductase FabG [Eumeta japonica]|uniref:3-oxoacyl-[acyl-carrier-protein] reductase FabG n=1 Tax=Eumeta variegata TaxID=151549 RepID=A0A4C1ZFD6_EUMVA|nr:3-oxoacyl-[acyl-carrier-protein] reductase FabG [Eumeta japonica]